ncbi:MAG: hypothetical protein PWR24_1772 [Desulfonauticus sp.]|jgi:CRISPR/Cas system CMR-associated protein Cmr5 small subunit|nr:hypothetical protein [Desulfonauticus sp.]
MVQNLDAVINNIGYQIVEKIKSKGKKDKTKYKNEIDKSLGVLSNDGVYAYFVYVKSKKVDDIFLNEIKSISKFVGNDNTEKELNQEFFEKLSENLSEILFFREILEKILIYARYHAKAMGD